MKLPVYLDYAATTPLDQRVLEEMLPYLSGQQGFGNPSSTHKYGQQAAQAIEQARANIAALINAEAREIIFTGSATEANNLAIKGVAKFYQHKGKHVITCKTEHSAVLDACTQLAREGFAITYLTPQANGLITIDALTEALREDTILVAIMHVNNEIGVIQDIATIGQLLREKSIFFHVDAVQSVGKLPINLQALAVDLMAFSAHKIYGPKGIGALYVRHKPRVRLQAQIHGGGQEQGLRAGTLATHQIVGMGTAFCIAQQVMTVEMQRITELRNRLWQGISELPEVYLNGDFLQRIGSNLNVAFGRVDGESLLLALKDLAISTGSACHAATIEISHVLRAMGVANELAHSSIRFSLGRYTTQSEIDFAIKTIQRAVNYLRSMSPLWI